MKQQNKPTRPTTKDASLLRSALLRLTATQKLISVVVVTVTAVIWYVLLKRLIAFGQGIDYSGLHALGVQTVSLLKQYNPFFWWVIVALCSLIIAWILYGFVQRQHRRSQRALVDDTVIASLSEQLSEPALDVLRWSWHDTRHPITVGDLQRTLHELRTGRADKITLARKHATLLRSISSAEMPQP